MIDKSCWNFVGDDDCNKCIIYGFIYSCPVDCECYEECFTKSGKEQEEKI